MFKVTADPTFTHKVRVMVPVDGGHTEQTFNATFGVMDVEELEKLQDEEGQVAVLKKVIRTMSDLVGDDDQPLPYSDALRDKLIGVPYVRIAMFQTYLKAITKAKAGN
jgi:hypothetical protein